MQAVSSELGDRSKSRMRILRIASHLCIRDSASLEHELPTQPLPSVGSEWPPFLKFIKLPCYHR